MKDLYRNFRYFVAVSLCLLTGLTGFSQEPGIEVRADSQEVFVGTSFDYAITITSAEPVHVQWPEFTDSFGAFEVLQNKPADSSAKAGKTIQEKKLTLIGFDPGQHFLPSLDIQYRYPGEDNYQSLITDSLQMQVKVMEVDTSKSIKPIKDPLEVPLTFQELKPWLLGGAGVLLLAGLTFWLIKRYRRIKQQGPQPKPERPPHTIAIEELQKLKSEELWQNGQVKEYHDRLTDILRAYIERVYHVHALELTTDEIMKQMKAKPLSDHQKANLRSVFEKADLAKFARVNPSPEDNEKAMEVAFEFIRETKPVTEEKVQEKEG